MRIGVIDIGTNSCRLLILDYNNSKFKVLKQGLIITRLGEGVDSTGRLKETAMNRVEKALENYAVELENYGVKKTKIVGTSALRDVSNASILLDGVYRKTGLRIEIISGEEEAVYNLQGAMLDLVDDNFILIDIGGGSTEFIWQDSDSIIYKSLNIGSVRMTERHLKDTSQPISDNELLAIEQDVSKTIIEKLNIKENSLQAVGLGGTITTLAAVNQRLLDYDPDKIHNYRLTYEEIGDIKQELADKTLQQRKLVPGLQPGRADVIIAGTVILQVIMKELSLDEVIVSEHDILYGLAKEIIKAVD
ncbi:Ppx/GppA family phosphatase [Iocasia frigidifontis]|uniref:Ppx/GppA family phosphatase n=1 Tax=Iocasia fonsfrigidae TaxID=2682810 RepID=A0A8A7KH05_9FIRM|nr:Ppx/GppA phosphatase family protein [Iocasia fonsfrigidae]QTL99365.1 Ppx/GppA family phosphatase [Iocasia fonsfrigidae]